MCEGFSSNSDVCAPRSSITCAKSFLNAVIIFIGMLLICSPLRVTIQSGEKLGTHVAKNVPAFMASFLVGGSEIFSISFSALLSHVPNLRISLLCSSVQLIFSLSMRTFSLCISCTVITGAFSVVVVSVCCVLLSVIVICSISFLRPACCRSRGDIFMLPCCYSITPLLLAAASFASCALRASYSAFAALLMRL